jgi:RsiW-degrading membrane proteinase PrsW (M82 family)
MATLQDNKAVIPLHRPGLKEKLFFFISGIIISIPFALFVESLSSYFLNIRLPEFYAVALSAAIIAPLSEEFAKAYPLFYRHGETERSIFILGFLVGLGFGIVEFLLYIFVFEAPILIRLPAILFHATNTSITAYGIATRQPIKFYLIAVAFHFSNNFFAVFGQFWLIGGVASIAISYFLSWRLYRKTSEPTMAHTISTEELLGSLVG